MIYIQKRNGQKEAYDPSKIENAIRKSFDGTGTSTDEGEIKRLLSAVEDSLHINGGSENEDSGRLSVELIQDKVEEALMQSGWFDVARAYILYRRKRAEIREVRSNIELLCGTPGLSDVLLGVEKDFPGAN